MAGAFRPLTHKRPLNLSFPCIRGKTALLFEVWELAIVAGTCGKRPITPVGPILCRPRPRTVEPFGECRVLIFAWALRSLKLPSPFLPPLRRLDRFLRSAGSAWPFSGFKVLR